MAKPCFVVYDDDMGTRIPFGLDTDCEGALTTHAPAAAVFPDRKAARRAIAISKKLASLEMAQGKPANLDFVESLRCVKIFDVELVGFTKADAGYRERESKDP